MPGPAGTLQQHQQNLSGSVPSEAFSSSSQHQQSYSNVLGSGVKGFAQGAMSGSPWGAIIGAGSSMLTQMIANRQNQRATAEAQRQAKENAATAYAREQASQDKANEWNRESSQVSRFIEAGLSPGLMYGQMSESSAQAVSAPAADTVQPMASALQDPKMLEALGLYLQQLQTGSNVGLQGAQSRNLDANTQGVQIDNQTRNQRNLQEIQESVARLIELKERARLSGSSADRIDKLVDHEISLMENQILVGASNARLNDSTVDRLHPAQAYQAYGAGKASYASADYTNGPLTSKTNQEARNLKVQENRGSFELVKDQDAYNWASSYLMDHGFDGSLAPQLLRFLDSAPSDVLKGGIQVVTSWLDGGNWLKFINDWRRTSHWSGKAGQGSDGAEPAPPGEFDFDKSAHEMWDNMSDDQLHKRYEGLSEGAKYEVSKRQIKILENFKDYWDTADESEMRNRPSEDALREKAFVEAVRQVMIDLHKGKTFPDPRYHSWN